jgi:hypothetical protein
MKNANPIANGIETSVRVIKLTAAGPTIAKPDRFQTGSRAGGRPP